MKSLLVGLEKVFVPAKLRMPRQLEGWSCLMRNLQQASRTELICRRLETGSRTCNSGAKEGEVSRDSSLSMRRKLLIVSHLHVVFCDEDLARVRVLHQQLQRRGVHVVQRHLLLQLLRHVVCRRETQRTRSSSAKCVNLSISGLISDAIRGPQVQNLGVVRPLTVKHRVEVRADRRQHHLVGANGVDADLQHHVTELKQKKPEDGSLLGRRGCGVRHKLSDFSQEVAY